MLDEEDDDTGREVTGDSTRDFRVEHRHVRVLETSGDVQENLEPGVLGITTPVG